MSGTERYRKGTVRYQIKALTGDSVGKLREKYLAVFGHESRSNHKQFLVRRIAWRLQANAEGDLSQRARERAVLLAEERMKRTLTPIQKHLLSGSRRNELKQDQGRADESIFSPGRDGGCNATIDSNVKVNQNCVNLSDPNVAGRGQAGNETSVAQDPNNPQHIVATYIDYRRGDGACGVSYSLNGGDDWNDSTIPVSFTNGAVFGAVRQYWQVSSDPSVAWDTKGNVYVACLTHQRGQPVSANPDQSDAVYVFRSTQSQGASWNFPARPVVESADTLGTGNAPLEDKPYLTVDNHPGSPFQDRVYVTWTELAADGTGYIWESYSADYGQTFSPRVLVSSDSALCVNNFGAGTPHGNCYANNYSQPFTGPDGTHGGHSMISPR
jgi:Protein of unknown function (DUF2924)